MAWVASPLMRLDKLLRFTLLNIVVTFGLVVRIPGFHPGGPGSILEIYSGKFHQGINFYANLTDAVSKE